MATESEAKIRIVHPLFENDFRRHSMPEAPASANPNPRPLEEEREACLEARGAAHAVKNLPTDIHLEFACL
jgi:hypothetical protein